MVEYSQGYKQKNQQALKALEEAVSPKANAVNRVLSSHFDKSATTQRANPAPEQAKSK